MHSTHSIVVETRWVEKCLFSERCSICNAHCSSISSQTPIDIAWLSCNYRHDRKHRQEVALWRHCPWMIPHPYDWFYQATAIIVLAVNVIFLFMIMWVSVQRSSEIDLQISNAEYRDISRLRGHPSLSSERFFDSSLILPFILRVKSKANRTLFYEMYSFYNEILFITHRFDTHISIQIETRKIFQWKYPLKEWFAPGR